MGILTETPFRNSNVDPGKSLCRNLKGLAPASALMQANGLCNLVSNGVDRVEGRHGILEDHSNLPAPNLPHFSLRQGQEILALKKNGPPIDFAGRSRDQAHDGKGCHRLAATGLANDAHDLPVL
jgi:hypothetical protein